MTPEEWVRQHFIHFLVDHKNYSKALIRVESGLRYNKVQKRTDILIYTREGAPHMLVECKSYKERISQKTFDQIMVYNRSLSTQYLVVTNGIEHYCCVLEEGRVLKFLEDIPNNGEKSE
ncbi:MAG: type I restriction enzyme HsdR N-terminal domain-containing protein [Bacteroidota bacterium]